MAMAALGQGSNRALEKTATRELAFEIFTVAFIDELVFVTSV